MDYQRHYDRLIETRSNLNRKKGSGVYYELHHINPLCMGGDNSEGNLILLTAREHFIAHLLLFRVYPNSIGLSFAFWLMCNSDSKYKCGSRLYSEMRSDISEKFKGVSKSESTKKKMRKPKSESHKVNISLGLLGIKFTESHRMNISKSAKGLVLSDTVKLKMSESRKGDKNSFYGKSHSPETRERLKESWKNREESSCPHCNKSSKNMGNLKRFHFDNCNKKPGI
jgi:hypothetical protein